MPKLDSAQIENIIDKVVPIIANPEDYEFFKGLLFIRLEASPNSADAALFVSELLATHQKLQ